MPGKQTITHDDVPGVHLKIYSRLLLYQFQTIKMDIGLYTCSHTSDCWTLLVSMSACICLCQFHMTVRSLSANHSSENLFLLNVAPNEA